MTTQVTTTAAKGSYATKSSKQDPYIYQVGFGNRFASEAIPNTLPDGQNSPQKCKYGLYSEQLTGSAFVTPRHQNQNAWLYRIRPAVAHQGFTSLPQNSDLESNFLPINPKVHVRPAQFAWPPADIPTEPTDFVEGLKTLAGSGEPTLREGLAVHIYAANKSMGKRAFVNNDGDFLIIPIQGRLDIQTEFGKIMVRPGEIVVIQRGIRFKVGLPDGPSSGYIQEIFGSHYELPQLGPLGANGLANARDFESPVAAFDIDQSPWDIIYKVSGTLHLCKQEHTPFDVVAWHGNYVPYKYNLEKFIYVGSISRDHPDPSVFCVLTAPSKAPGAALADFLIIGPRWDVASEAFRLPYYHRNSAVEFAGVIFGQYGALSPGGAFGQNGFCPHGVPYEDFKAAREAELKPMRIGEGSLMFVFESCLQWTYTDYAMKRSGWHDPKLLDKFKAEFINNLDQVNADLREFGLEELHI